MGVGCGLCWHGGCLLDCMSGGGITERGEGMRATTVEEWKAAADAICWKRHGCSLDDLADVCYADMYEDGVTPAGAVRRAVRNQSE